VMDDNQQLEIKHHRTDSVSTEQRMFVDQCHSAADYSLHRPRRRFRYLHVHEF
jgi:hypothetical protein